MMESLRIGLILTRLAGTDGVSLETKKWVEILEDEGHETFFIAGELDTPSRRSVQVERFHFKHPDIKEIHDACFQNGTCRPRSATEKIHQITGDMKDYLYKFYEKFDLDLIIPENVLTIPMNLPLGLAVTELIAETCVPTIAHHHDFYWERKRFLKNCVWDILNAAFPPTYSCIEHVVINSSAAHQLAHRTGMSSTLIPNVMDFENPPDSTDEYASDVREEFGISEDELFVLQPTRIVPRKRIEEAIELLSYLNRPCKLLISHASGDEGYEYERHIRRFAEHMDVDTLFVAERIAPERGKTADGNKIYSLDDIYPHADLVTYPSEYEGFGNAFIETVLHRKPVVVNNYSVFEQDIAPKGFEVVEFDGYIKSETVNHLRKVIDDSSYRQEMVETNFNLGKKYYSYRKLDRELTTLLQNLFGVQ